VKELQGPQKALECIRTIPGIDYLQHYYLLHGILAELHAELENKEQARKHYGLALKYVVSEAEKRLVQQKLEKL
jgi:predicted RNA polymerase sigma factor